MDCWSNVSSLLINEHIILVTIPQDETFINGETIIEQFFQRKIGQAWNERRASQLMDVCLAVSSLGNVIVTTCWYEKDTEDVAPTDYVAEPAEI
ncbi:predicted protein [Sclerotinia sclerotiorum 1980 UF-70]|uniref:Uncharacterized protein n=1 Tax=Sclerotinia sclerotiorum (strain ATCC 18683 / 1980 / Ss-1) TaxID=665079 RepID=A7EZX4_SCLS1|nr:predicted protein [Sclerotinia sclerotiorum 1980 UF-70]EDN95016.1 predicted protein [Sclerotinia sclerotiorum 1980 UF-70]